jgi:hypothetical protein
MDQEDSVRGKVRHCDLCGSIIGKRLQGTRCHNCPNDEVLMKRAEDKLMGATPEMVEKFVEKFVDDLARAKQIPRKFLGFR